MMSGRTMMARLGVGMALLLPLGCGESAPAPTPGADILTNFELGSPQADVVEALPPGGLTPTAEISEAQLDHGYLSDQYLVEGETVVVLWVHDPAAGLPTEDLRQDLTPIVFRGGVLDGVGWDHLDDRRAEWGLPDRWAGPAPDPPDDPQQMTSF